MRSRKISILGSTGSVGVNTLKVVEHLGDIGVNALAGGRNLKLLAEQTLKFSPRVVSCADEECAKILKELLLAETRELPEIVFGEAGLIEAAVFESSDTLVSATVGAVGFVPTLRALEHGKRVALANKETLVMAGELMTRAAGRSGAEILPVDSEHNALHQCLRGERHEEVKRLILTASGGPFLERTFAEMEVATKAEALAHPTWNMGEKISVDSSTLMNKGLEVIEAHWLFGFDANQIDVIVHPQSVIHSLVELIDGSMIAQLGATDMRHPIQYSLTYPDREPQQTASLELASLTKLTFEKPDFVRFPNLKLAYTALNKGGTTPAALNASNEIAVRAFLDGKIKLTDIALINSAVVEAHISEPATELAAILAADKNSRKAAEAQIYDTLNAASV
ncbi:MAG: 1-deoxy-D-xylulose-5-phosphate reductoisomerase [Pyrinomonadaceae bacterium]